MDQPATDTKPWYRQFWPWLLISIPAATAVAGFATIWLASSEPVALVRDDYYKEGMAVNRNLARDRAAVERGLSSQLTFDTAERRIHATMTGDHQAKELTLSFIHPLEIDRDQSVTLSQEADGSFTGALPVAADRWYLQLEDRAGTVWRLKGEVDLRKTPSTRLPPEQG